MDGEGLPAPIIATQPIFHVNPASYVSVKISLKQRLSISNMSMLYNVLHDVCDLHKNIMITYVSICVSVEQTK